jgi:hypothetical protein
VADITVYIIRTILEKLGFGQHARKRFFSVCVLLLATGFSAWARAAPDINDPLGFFTTVANKMLRSTFPFGVTNIPVYTNGVFVYTPAVQRLLQLSANLYDAANTNSFPVVFRPLFARDAAGDIYIIGYQQVTNVSGADDPQLAPPYDVTQLSAATTTPIADGNGPVNVYGVPWIIGAKKGLPGFNQFYLTNTVEVTRKLEFVRPGVGAPLSTYATNQMYVMSINTGLGISFWNAYNSVYLRPVTVCASDVVWETLTNGINTWAGFTNFIFPPTIIPSWPGSQWSGSPPFATPQAASFVTANWEFNFLPPSVYRFTSQVVPGPAFDPIGSATSSIWEITVPPLPQLPPFGLTITNYLQAFILDGNNVIDYVQLCAPSTQVNLNSVLADPNGGTGTFWQWSTNGYPASNPSSIPSYGVYDQFYVSGHPNSAPPSGGGWLNPAGFLPAPMLSGLGASGVPGAEAAFFDAFFSPSSVGAFQYNGQIYYNTNLIILAPYIPTRIIFSPYLLQVNDPLVHYLASDLNAQTGASAAWGNGSVWLNGVWSHVDNIEDSALPTAPIVPIGGRYQPWGQERLMAYLANVDTNAYNLAFKDPLVWWSDAWNFPTNLLPSLVGLGQVHRGTPWQTIYLKATNVLEETSSFGNEGLQNIGTNTWMQWTGDPDANDAALMAPVSDWRLAGLLMSVLNTNDATRLFSVNDPNIADWQNLLNGLTVYSNSTALALPGVTPTFDTYVMASNSPQASVIADGIIQTKSSQMFYSIGDILATPALTDGSPFLNLGNAGFGQQQMNYGINDTAYEAIPAQLLPLLRPDSIGSLAPTNGGWTLWFSGADGYDYVLQTSTDLMNWSAVSTNCPVQGGFNAPVSPPAGSPSQFYRSVLLP